MKKVRHILLIALAISTLISYLSVWVSPATFKYAAAISIFIPVFLILNMITAMVLVVKRSKKALLPILLLVIAYPFFLASISFNSLGEAAGQSVSLMSYNVKGFVSYKRGKDRSIFEYVADLDSDINCFQEFYNQGNYVNSLRQEGVYEVIHDKKIANLAIVSKYPVLRHGVLFPDQTYNNIMFADILLRKGDTLRIYNAHLQSMGITHTNPDYYEGIVSEYDQAKTKFLEGAVVRAEQIKVLLEHANSCTYPILITGDFNDVPFSYNYFKIRRGFKNAFEEAGSGFGFTYNGDLPFLRIDNQFFNEKVEVLSFETLDSVDFSDHYPTLGIYSISD